MINDDDIYNSKIYNIPHQELKQKKLALHPTKYNRNLIISCEYVIYIFILHLQYYNTTMKQTFKK